MEPNTYASAGRHMNQRFRSTVSASPQSTQLPPVNLVEEWIAESERLASSRPDDIRVDRTIPLAVPNSTPLELDAVARKMLSIDQRELTHRRKKRVAAALVVSVITTIPLLLVALLFFV